MHEEWAKNLKEDSIALLCAVVWVTAAIVVEGTSYVLNKIETKLGILPPQHPTKKEEKHR